MSHSRKRGLSPKQLQMFILGWFGVSVLLAVCIFVVILLVAGNTAQPSGTQTARRPTPRPGVSTPTPIAGSQGIATEAPVDNPTPQGIADDGKFALGGQVPPYLEYKHQDQMVSAQMSWVKYQIVWTPASKPIEARKLIQFAHEKGFKVLVSIKGDLNPTAIDYEAYINYVTRLFSTPYLPDAIEIWNEMNFNKEWPANDISGTSYVNNLLSPVSKIVKEKSPTTLVISGAPTPTGAFGGSCGNINTGVSQVAGCDDNYYMQQMKAAGAANLIDCVGVHFNSGATAPSAATGHPNDDGTHHYSWYFQPMLDLYYNTFNKPLCFTEMGYVSAEGVGTPPVNFPWASRVTVAQQAQWLGEAVSLSSKSGKVRLIIIWNVDFPSSAPDDPQAMYAIVRPDGSCPACTALSSAMTGQ